jgi:hypothetical protein
MVFYLAQHDIRQAVNGGQQVIPSLLAAHYRAVAGDGHLGDEAPLCCPGLFTGYFQVDSGDIGQMALQLGHFTLNVPPGWRRKLNILARYY